MVNFQDLIDDAKCFETVRTILLSAHLDSIFFEF
jgi:hypothetical protein